jgi:hypothetical protein
MVILRRTRDIPEPQLVVKEHNVLLKLSSDTDPETRKWSIRAGKNTVNFLLLAKTWDDVIIHSFILKG